ncbi:hypothetical protein [Kibdelosporangium phytohabitans]|uniref:XRE family transcriptional regulator n=1 Tax=Kibdelosporangium phytohabitans TaxID=860235 RepID=A0A0N9HXD1_9PSEU|nr:hypothetical protein [Kibdelosporangium phytohabitans]ALG06866.1 hypothetical protein AOZ06_07905 [Kibdelosporangium phytohabitans]MBE1468115.1 transcriptional regulator with XRE-family HTH domain [Kibdelosporangium phytohabitans]
MTIDGVHYQLILGDELRRLRRARGLTREQLRLRFPDPKPSTHTLATYELGTRQCSMVRFAEICLVLDELPHVLLARVHKRVVHDDQIHVDLRKVNTDRRPELEPLRRWARGRLHPHSTEGAVVYLPFSAIHHLAGLCGIDTTDLISHLTQLTKAENQ